MPHRIRLLRRDLTHEIYDDLLRSPRIAWDIETSGLDWRDGQIGTCQIYSDEAGTVVVQLHSDDQPKLLGLLLSDDRVEKVFHHAPFDLRWMTAHWKVTAASVACTKVASRLVTPDGEQSVHSLKSLLANRLSTTIEKDQRLSDWTRRDLTEEQLLYASGDVEHLLRLLAVLEAELQRKGLSSIYRSCMDYLPTHVALQVGGWPDIFKY